MYASNENSKLIEFYQEKLNDFLIHLSAAKELKEDEIHKLRVNLKYIKSLLLLLEEVSVPAGAKLYKRFKSLFKRSGQLRALQVSKSMLQKNQIEIPKEIFDILEARIAIVSKQVLTEIVQFDLVKFKKNQKKVLNALMQIDVKELLEGADRIIAYELDIVTKLFNSSSEDEHHHEIRKLLKQVKGLLCLLLAVCENESQKQMLNLINKAETSIGNWHDYKALENIIRTIEKEIPKTDSKRVLRNLKNCNNRRKQEQKRESDSLLRTYFNPFTSNRSLI